jgi:hypothetical protein
MGRAISPSERQARFLGATGIATKSGLKQELRELSNDLQVKNILSSLNAAVDRGMKVPDAVSYLLILDLKAMLVTVKPFTLNNMSDATDEYLQIEKQTQDNPQMLAVLVAVKSINALRAAYPNYYLDANAFLDALTFAVK